MVSGVNLYSMNNVHSLNRVSAPSFKGEEMFAKKELDKDCFEFQHKVNGAELSKEDKQEIVRSARATAAGWSMLGGPLSLLYFGLRSDKTVAEKYNLDENNDKKLIKQIKREQALWSLPGCIHGLGLIPAAVSYIYNKNMDASKIDVD